MTRSSVRLVRFALTSFIASILILAILPLSSAVGQQGGGYRITPLRNELNIDRGGSESITITVRNVTGSPDTIGVRMLDFVPDPLETGQPKVVLGEVEDFDNPYSLKPFVSQPASQLVAPNEDANFEIDINIPSDAAPGAYYGVVQARSVATGEGLVPEDGESSAVGLNASVGSIVLLEVPGDNIELLSLASMSAATINDGGVFSTGTFFSEAPTHVQVRLENQGNIFSAPFGKIVVKNWGGDVVHEYEFNATDPRGNILPSSIRAFADEIENIGSFGRYTVEANIAYGEGGGSIISASSSFWVMPWLTIAFVVVGIVLTILFFTRGIKAYNSMILNKSKKTTIKNK